MNTEEYIVYVLDNNDDIYDICGEFNTLEKARQYIKLLELQDMKRLIYDKYAIYLRTEINIE